jgi:peptide chain release factor 1
MTWPNTVRKKDLKIEFLKGSGPGGQHRNKRATACRITHLPTGISAEAQDSKSQHRNKANAFLKLSDKLVPLMKVSAITPRIRENVTDRVRTYHEPDNRVVDHRLPGQQWRFTDVLEKDKLDEIIEELNESVISDR